MLNKVSNYRDLSHSFLLCITSVVKEWETLDAFCIPDYLFSVTFIGLFLIKKIKTNFEGY